MLWTHVSSNTPSCIPQNETLGYGNNIGCESENTHSFIIIFFLARHSFMISSSAGQCYSGVWYWRPTNVIVLLLLNYGMGVSGIAEWKVVDLTVADAIVMKIIQLNRRDENLGRPG